MLSDTAFIRCEEVIRAHHALSHLGGSEGGGLCSGDCPPRSGARQSEERPSVGASRQEPHPGEFLVLGEGNRINRKVLKHQVKQFGCVSDLGGGIITFLFYTMYVVIMSLS